MLILAVAMPLPQSDAASVLVLNGILKQQDGKILAGSYDVRVSFWHTQKPAAEDELSIVDNKKALNINSKNYTGFSEEHVVTSATNGSYNLVIGRLINLDPVFDGGFVYLQVDVKPSGSDFTNWRRIVLPDVSGTDRKPVLLSDLQSTRIRFEMSYGTYGGVLMDKDSKPLTGEYFARLSLWSSANYDKDFDMLPDGSIRSASSNYQGYSLEVPFSTDKLGRFVLPVGPFNSEFIDPSKPLYVQLEIRKKDDPQNNYDLIDPDGDLDSKVDRFAVKDGQLTADTNVASLGDSEKLLVSNIPGGTTSRYFELGVGDTLPVGYYEIRVPQADGKSAALRYNALEKRWEVSNDGVVFTPIAALVNGTTSRKFTIGLGNSDKVKFGLQFGDSLKPARIVFDAARDVFVVNKSIDLQQHQLVNAVLENRAAPPTLPVEGQQYYNTLTKTAYYYNGGVWVSMGNAGANTNAAGNTAPPAFVPAPVSNTTIIQQIVGGGTGGGVTPPIPWSDLETRSKSYIFDPQNVAAVFKADAASNGKGTVDQLHDDTNDINFYRWTTQQATQQSVQLVFSWVIPEDFTSFQPSPLNMQIRTTTTDPVDSHADLAMSLNNTPLTMAGATNMASGTTNTWTTLTPQFSGGTPHPGDKITFMVTLATTPNMATDMGPVTINYVGK